MTWIERLDSVFSLTTGDGQVYTPLWKPTSKGLEWNVSEFNFKEQPGTLVKKLQPIGRKFPLEFWFQGDDHLDIANAFEESANDRRPWVINHPYYGSITVQCPALNVDHTDYGISKFSATVIETITEDSPKVSVSPLDKIIADKAINDADFLEAFDEEIDAANATTLAENNEEFYTEGSRLSKLLEQAQGYFDAFNAAQSAVNNAAADAKGAMKAAQNLINKPAMFAASVKDRIASVKSSFNDLKDSVTGIVDRVKKKFFESQGGALISSMALASALPQDGDYENANDVLSIIDPIIEAYNDYVATLDSVQSENGGAPDSYIPDAQALIGLNALITFTVSNLFNIALQSKQERSFILETDSNWVNLAHKVYGMSPEDDSAIQLLIDNNKAGLNEMLQVKKGRRIIYYV